MEFKTRRLLHAKCTLALSQPCVFICQQVFRGGRVPDLTPIFCTLPQDRLKDLNSQADSLMTSSAFDTSQVKDKRDTINGRFQKIKSMATARRAKLNESHRLHQFFRDMDDEESWIKYVLPLAWLLHIP